VGASQGKRTHDNSVGQHNALTSGGAFGGGENSCTDVQALREAIQVERARVGLPL